jgi:ferrochelatase
MSDQHATKPRIGVVLLNLGGPDTLDAVKPFLTKLFTDREIVRLPGGRVGQAIIGRIIVAARLKGVKRNYAAIGGGSPILPLTLRQASALEANLRDGGVDAVVRPAMRYWHPFTEETLAEFKREGVRRLVALTLYPHYSVATTGSSINELQRVIERDFPDDFETTYIREWPSLPKYLDALAAKVSQTLATLSDDKRENVTLLFSAHGLPVDFIERGDPYIEHIHETIDGVMKRLTEKPPWCLAYQSRVGPVKWLQPTTPDTMRRLAAEGVRDVVIVPVSFVTDHIETFEEIDRQFGRLAKELGFETFRRIEALNDDPTFIAGLGNLVREHLQTAGVEEMRNG